MREGTDTKRKHKPVRIEFHAGPHHQVRVAGSFNKWRPEQQPMNEVDGNGNYEAVIRLPPGRHEYKFVVDGQWRMDAANPQWALNGMGTLNSVIEVKQ